MRKSRAFRILAACSGKVDIPLSQEHGGLARSQAFCRYRAQHCLHDYQVEFDEREAIVGSKQPHEHENRSSTLPALVSHEMNGVHV